MRCMLSKKKEMVEETSELLRNSATHLKEFAGIEFTIYRGEQEDDLNEEGDAQSEQLKNLADLSKKKIGPISKVPQGALPTEIVERIEDVEIKTPSLLDRPVQEDVPEERPDSLLAR